MRVAPERDARTPHASTNNASAISALAIAPLANATSNPRHARKFESASELNAHNVIASTKYIGTSVNHAGLPLLRSQALSATKVSAARSWLEAPNNVQNFWNEFSPANHRKPAGGPMVISVPP